MGFEMENGSNKIILGHPFSAALYAYFDKELTNGSHIKSSEWHGYYRTLYGKHYEANIDMALTLSLIYDDIIVPGVDNAFPDSHKYLIGDEYYNPEFGLYFSYEPIVADGQSLEEQVKITLSDREISALLWNIPKNAHTLIISEVFNELAMARRFNVPIFSLGKRQAIAKRISQLQHSSLDFIERSKVQFVSDYLDITGLLFNPVSVDSFYYLKREKDVREYSKAFVKVLEEFQPNNVSPR